MKLSISNIAWPSENDAEMYSFLPEHGFKGIEIAPTRIFPDTPYKHITEATDFASKLYDTYGLVIPSMQSIWYGRNESIFGSDSERQALVDYTKQAILFAEAVSCRNLVFGCPRNRNISSPELRPIAVSFFRDIGDFAALHKTVIAIEPNPPYYNTNFINTTAEAFDFCHEINCPGVKVNVDLGTTIHYGESLSFLNEHIDQVNHIHISEPLLAVIEHRDIHRELSSLNYQHWFSIEMKNTGDINTVKKVVQYIEEALL